MYYSPSFRRLVHFVVCLAILLLIASCTSSGDGEVVSAKIEVFTGQQDRRLISEEKITQDNCSGSAETSQTVTRSHTILYSLEVGTGFSVNTSGEVGVPGIGQVGVGSEIASYYSVSYGGEDTVSRAVTVAAKEGTNMQHTIQHFEVWEQGEVLIIVGDVTQRLPYSFRRDFSIEAVAPANLGCSTPPTEDAVSVATIPSTVATATSTIFGLPGRTVDDAESTGTCGPNAFAGNIAAANPTFTRPSGHTSGWISTSLAKVTLPNVISAEYLSGFVLFV